MYYITLFLRSQGKSKKFLFLLKVSGERDGKVVDAKCHALTAPHVR